MMRPCLGFVYWSITYPDTLGAKKKPARLKNTWPNAELALCYSLLALDMITPKHVGATAEPKNSNAKSPNVKWYISSK